MYKGRRVVILGGLEFSTIGATVPGTGAGVRRTGVDSMATSCANLAISRERGSGEGSEDNLLRAAV
ncbi:MAG TPA: hypothetical protein VFL57_00720 [Bryobacteraceae bacterium]|nr:hypothetical protein [Bryobacteraceae bacterium]